MLSIYMDSLNFLKKEFSVRLSINHYDICIHITTYHILATCCRHQGPKKRRKTSKTTQKDQNWLKIKGKHDAKICSEILVAVVFRFFSKCDTYMYNTYIIFADWKNVWIQLKVGAEEDYLHGISLDYSSLTEFIQNEADSIAAIEHSF